MAFPSGPMTSTQPVPTGTQHTTPQSKEVTMKIKTMIMSAVAALAISGALASVASAENGQFMQTNNGPIPAHTLETPTGPMVVPDKLVEKYPDGATVAGVVCGYAS